MELVAGHGRFPAENLAVDIDGTAVFVAPIDILAVDVETRRSGYVEAFGDAKVEVDFLGDFFTGHVGTELVEVSFVAGDFEEILFK